MLHCSAAVALARVATDANKASEAPVAPATFRLLASSGSSSPSPPPRRKEPAFFVYQAPAKPVECAPAIDAADAYLEVGNSDKETNWDDTKFGHAQFMCLEPMIRGELQYAKAISYAWCAHPHCEEKCPGADCPVHDTVAKCQSAVKNWLGYAERKKVNANLTEAQRYYDDAIAAWPENCGALGYRAELELQKGSVAGAKSKLSALCTNSACSEHNAVRETTTTFWKHANLGRENVPLACDWALGLVGVSMAAAHHVAFVVFVQLLVAGMATSLAW